ncbi:hypothetical protein [Mesorhizobium sp. 1M-11]|uniref:hypothetical protein n=1 Tax=Mesorhizobium sp. 1M-11 TaxID=1529006 RepID=UPI0006C75EDA|nr:hypothetical protein [Mesorhizobium sp. 1M-11]
MDPIEKAIRNAFEKGDPDDRAFRERVYRSAFAALDRALLANPNVTVEVAMKRRKAMQAKIAEIESEFLPAVPGAAPEVDLDGEIGDRAPSSAAPSQPGGRVEPSLGAPGEAPRSRVLPVVPDIIPEGSLPPSAAEAALAGSLQVSPDRDTRRIGRRLPLTAIFFGVTILALVGIGLWWAIQSNAFKTLEQLGQSPAQTPTVSDEDYQPEGAPKLSGDDTQNRNWINVFSPESPAQVATPSDAKAEVMKDESGAFIRVTSGASGSAVSFDVGQGILEQIAGKKAVFDIIARAEDGKETQMSVDCNFGELGDCGRKRYVVGNERNEYLFDVQLPSGRPGSAGTIAINSDFDKQGKSVDIYEIRVSVTE